MPLLWPSTIQVGSTRTEAQTTDSASAKERIRTDVSAELAVYSDTNAVTVVSPSAAATVESPFDDWSASGHYLVDVVAGSLAGALAYALAFRDGLGLGVPGLRPFRPSPEMNP